MEVGSHPQMCKGVLGSHCDEVKCVANNENSIISCSFDGTIRLWDKGLKSHPKILDDAEGHNGHILSVSISSNGVVASGSDDTTVW